MKICSICQIEKEDTDYYKHHAKCILCNKIYAKEYRRKTKETDDAYRNKYYRMPAARFSKAKRAAIKRNKNWSITMEEYLILISNNCYYCDGYFGKVEVGTGLDRIDNTKGYESSNVVSCCETCNKIKSDILSAEETKATIKLIIFMRLNYNIASSQIQPSIV